MPGWLIHISFAYLVSKLLKIRDISLVLIGSILPDVARILSLLDFFDLAATTYYAYLTPLHSPFLVLIATIALSFLFKKPLRAFLLIAFGAFTHLFLDQLQSAYYTGKLLLYPFSYIPFKSFNLFWADSGIAIFFMVISIFILVYAIFDKNKKSLKFTFKKIHLVILFGLIYLIIPLLTFNTFMQNDPYIQQFENNNQELYISYAEVTSENPLILKEMDYEYEVLNQIDVKENDWVSAIAENSNNKITIKEHHKHNRYLKEGTSFVALILLMIIIFKNPKRFKITK